MLAGACWLWIRSGSCLPGQFHCGASSKPPYPTCPLPPTAQEIQVDISRSGVRYITFVTSDTPQAVFDFYRATLPIQGWELNANGTTTELLQWAYLNGPGGPAFRLEIWAESTNNGTTNIKTRQIISGPFSPTWPDD